MNEKMFTIKLVTYLRNKPVNCKILSITVCFVDSWTFRKVDKKYLKSFQMWCWRIEKITWTECVTNEEVLHRVKEEKNIAHTVNRRKLKWIGHILRRNCLLHQVIEGKIKGGIEVTGRRGRRRRKLLDELKERRGYCHLK